MSEVSVVAPESAEEAKTPIVVTVTPSSIAIVAAEISDKIRLTGVEIHDGRAIVVDRDAMLADEQSLKELKALKKRAVGLRSKLTDEHKVIKEPHWKMCCELDENKRLCLKAIKVFEDKIDFLEDAYQAELKLIQKEAEDDLLRDRLAILNQMGADPSMINEDQIRKFDEDQFAKLQMAVTADIKRRAELEAERIRLEEQRQEFERQQAEQQRILDEQKAENERILAEQRAELARLKAEQDAALAEQKRLNEEAMAEQKRLADIAAQQAETARIEEQNRLREQQLELDRQRREIEDERIKNELEAERVRAQELLHQHERESAEVVAEQAQIEEYQEAFVEQVVDPYMSLSVEKPALLWHEAAAEEIRQFFDDQSDSKADWNPQFQMHAVAKIIAKHDPA